MNDTVRNQKSGDQLAVGDWLAPGELLDGAAEVLHALTYRPDHFTARENEKHVHLVVREHGKVAPYADIVGGGTLFGLASEADLAELHEQVERAQKIADIRAMADWLERNPSVPMSRGVRMQESPDPHGDVWNSGAEGIAEVLRVAELSGGRVHEDNERTDVTVSFGGSEYNLIAWHKDGRLAEPKPEITDPTGLAYTRADDDTADPTPTGPRQALHTGGLTEGGLVDETDVGSYLVYHGPVKPPYGTPERADWDSDHEFDHLDHTHES